MPSAIVKSTTTLVQRAPLSSADVLRAFFSRRSPRTVEAYRGDLALLRSWLEGEGHDVGADISSLTSWLYAQGPGPLNALLLQWSNEQLEAGRAPFTVNRRLSAVRSLIKLGRTLGLLNWTLDVQGVKGAQGVRDMRGPKGEDVKRVFATATDAQSRAALHLLYTRGLRSVEVRELRMEHLRLDDCEVLVRGKGMTGLHPVTVSESTVEALRLWLHVRGPGPGFVFTVRDASKMMGRTTFWRMVKRMGARANVTLRPHGLRHSAITAALDATGGDVRKVQKFSRHKKVETVLKYDDERRDVGGELTETLAGGVT